MPKLLYPRPVFALPGSIREEDLDHGVLGATQGQAPGPYLERFDNTGADVVYHGWAAPGSSTALPVWAIAKYSYDANDEIASIEWARGQISFDNIWDNRTNGGYG